MKQKFLLLAYTCFVANQAGFMSLSAAESESPVAFYVECNVMASNTLRFRYHVINRSIGKIKIKAGGVRKTSIVHGYSIPDGGGGATAIGSDGSDYGDNSRLIELSPRDIYGSEYVAINIFPALGDLFNGVDIPVRISTKIAIVDDDGRERVIELEDRIIIKRQKDPNADSIKSPGKEKGKAVVEKNDEGERKSNKIYLCAVIMACLGMLCGIIAGALITKLYIGKKSRKREIL